MRPSHASKIAPGHGETESARNLGADLDHVLTDDADQEQIKRPARRSECPSLRPCPWVGCRYHLALRVSESGRLWLHPQLKAFGIPDAGAHLEELPHTCLWDVVREGVPMTLQAIGDVLHISRERVRLLEADALEELGQPLEGWAP